MPLGYERLNVRHRSPNERIVFIKPLAGSDKATSQDFLERIAAICAPTMKANYLSVVSLEEYEPNREFWGRNFNAGEVIQLVLKSPSNGRWLPFSFVQMVMMHELAHCKQMNHSGAFWTVRNQYTAELKELWAKNYTGDGFWGKGQTLYDGQYTQDNMPAAEQMPQHLCGGVYKSGRGKRKRKAASEKPTLSYAERKQRRIEKKFGTNGVALGQDEDARVGLERGRRVAAKPRVAGSARGRELRAAAALARFEQVKDIAIKDEDDDSETDDQDDDDEQSIKEEAFDTAGNRILDSKGNGMVKVCEDEDTKNDPNARRELEELGQFGINLKHDDNSTGARPTLGKSHHPPTLKIKEEDISTASESEGELSGIGRQHIASQRLSSQRAPIAPKVKPERTQDKHNPTSAPALASTLSPTGVSETLTVQDPALPNLPINPISQDVTPATKSAHHTEPTSGHICEVCSLSNTTDALTCAACAHVLHPDRLPHHWRCQSETCRGSQYINSADSGRCGICARLKDAVCPS